MKMNLSKFMVNKAQLQQDQNDELELIQVIRGIHYNKIQYLSTRLLPITYNWVFFIKQGKKVEARNVMKLLTKER